SPLVKASPGIRVVARVFLSSRGRHTRFSRDWSSDVCSSDLVGEEIAADVVADLFAVGDGFLQRRQPVVFQRQVGLQHFDRALAEIGRASCRERGGRSGAAIASKRRKMYSVMRGR